MRRHLIVLIVLVGVLYAQDDRPFEINVVPRYVDEKRIVVNIQLTNVTNKSLDYLEGFLIERNSSRKIISEKNEPFIIAEMSGNHNNSIETALKIVEAAASAGADAIKLQTFTPEDMTLDIKDKNFKINDKKSQFVW